MDTSVVVDVPVGEISHWCVQPLWARGTTPECYNLVKDTTAEDFMTICCDGVIISKSRSFPGYHLAVDGLPDWGVELDDLVCCRADKPQSFNPIEELPNGIGTTCAAGSPTPLASLAATNTENATLDWPSTTKKPKSTTTPTPGSFGGGGDDVSPDTSICIWMRTARSSQKMTQITVAKVEASTVATSGDATSTADVKSTASTEEKTDETTPANKKDDPAGGSSLLTASIRHVLGMGLVSLAIVLYS